MALIKEAEAGNKKEAGVILKYMNAMMRNNRNYLAVFTGATGCLCENTIIKGQTKTLGELYLKGERFIDTISFSHNPTKSQSEIIDSGKKELYEIELDEGKNVKATKEHKFFLKENFKFKEDISESGAKSPIDAQILLTSKF